MISLSDLPKIRAQENSSYGILTDIYYKKQTRQSPRSKQYIPKLLVVKHESRGSCSHLVAEQHPRNLHSLQRNCDRCHRVIGIWCLPLDTRSPQRVVPFRLCQFTSSLCGDVSLSLNLHSLFSCIKPIPSNERPMGKTQQHKHGQQLVPCALDLSCAHTKTSTRERFSTQERPSVLKKDQELQR